ncbi:STE/STE11/BCK1 protein [Salix suchowensis]|nr:STE/STE11/BCK1 protein [Salix suchowensis]
MGEAVVLGTKWILAKNIARWNEEDPAVIAFCAETNASGNDAGADVGADVDDNPDTEHADAEVDHADGGDNDVDAAAAAKEAKLVTALRIIITSIEEDKVVQIPDRAGITLSIMETICQLVDVDHTSITDVSKKALLARKLRDEIATDSRTKCERLDEDALSAIFREGSREPSVANREEEASNAKAIRNAVKAILACGLKTTNGSISLELAGIDLSELVPRTRKSMLAEAAGTRFDLSDQIITCYVYTSSIQIMEDDTAFAAIKMRVQAASQRDQPLLRRVVLGKDVMQEIWTDMGHTQLPSWVSGVSREWSTTSELSADQTRILCTIHLPITLIRLWHSADDRRQSLLANFMDLVNAVRVANMRTTSPGDVETYNTYMHRYMVQALELYQDEAIKPHQHAALHIGTMLEWFGPVHAHSAPYYERYINFMHRAQINRKPRYTLGSMLAAGVSVDEDYEAPLTELLSGAADFNHAIFYDDIYIGGIPYGRRDRVNGEIAPSCFIPHPQLNPKQPYALSLPSRLPQTPIGVTDPAGYLCSSSRGLHIVAVSELISHCAVTKMGCGDESEVFHILSLEKVGPHAPP